MPPSVLQSEPFGDHDRTLTVLHFRQRDESVGEIATVSTHNPRYALGERFHHVSYGQMGILPKL